jgi:hypothetical protein
MCKPVPAEADTAQAEADIGYSDDWLSLTLQSIAAAPHCIPERCHVCQHCADRLVFDR